jgi:hypothetical protein
MENVVEFALIRAPISKLVISGLLTKRNFMHPNSGQ